MISGARDKKGINLITSSELILRKCEVNGLAKLRHKYNVALNGNVWFTSENSLRKQLLIVLCKNRWAFWKINVITIFEPRDRTLNSAICSMISDSVTKIARFESTYCKCKKNNMAFREQLNWVFYISGSTSQPVVKYRFYLPFHLFPIKKT